MRRLAVWLLTGVVLVGSAATASAAPKATLSDIEDEVMCPTCGTALSLSESPLAQRQRAFIQRLIDEGRSKEEIKARLVDEFGREVLASPPREGFSLAAYLVPLAAAVLAVGSLALALVRRRGGSSQADVAAGDSFEDLVDADLAGFRPGDPPGPAGSPAGDPRRTLTGDKTGPRTQRASSRPGI